MAINLASSLRGCRSWDDLQKRWKDCDKKTKGDLFEALVKNYLLLTPEFASKFKAVWGFKEIPSSVFQKLKLPSSDKGIDLVAETKEGDYWAIQCKYREDSSDQITWREISTFMGLYLGRKQISFGLIASTTERITKVLKDHDRVGFLAYDIWQGLDEEFFKRLQARLYKKKEPLKARLPRPHQKEAIRDAVAYFKKSGNRRGKLIMPCGTGKSLTSFFIAEKLKAQRVLIAVPSLSLIRQTLKEWMRESLARNHKVEWICVCSDESAGKIDQDVAVVLTQDLGVPCLTDPKQIASWLKHKHRARTIIFTTYQSGQALAKAARNTAFTFDLGIMDEAHKTAGAKDRLFSHLILDKNIKITRRLFMTATERRYRGESDEILSMEDPDDYGETIHKLSFKKALEYRPAILSDYKVVTIHISQKEIAELVRNRIFVRLKVKGWNKKIEAENLAALIALRKTMKKYPIRHAVSFHGSIRRAQIFKESNEAYSKTFPSGGSLQTFHVSGKTPTGTRAREIEQFSKAHRSLITNARCLNEGVDVPNIDAILFADPRKSLVDIVQAVGRALRPSPNKKFGYVIVPVVHKKSARTEEVLESKSFKEVLTTLCALGSQDDRIIEYFRSISQGKEPRSNQIFEGVLTEELAKKIDLKKFIRSIQLRCWDRLARLSWRNYVDARTFVRKLKLKDSAQWFMFAKGKLFKSKGTLPSDIPANPRNVYKEWKSMGDWLGTGNVATFLRSFIDFEDARRYARKLKLRNNQEWRRFAKGENQRKKGRLPPNIPSSPDRVYSKLGWQDWGDWLGTGRIGNNQRKYWPFYKARRWIRKLKLKNQKDWLNYLKNKKNKLPKKPIEIPSSPSSIYKQWVNLGDWLGNGNLSSRGRKYLSFKKARALIRKRKIPNLKKWKSFTRTKGFKKLNIPANPQAVYIKKGWIGLPDWLGNENPVRGKFWKFQKARQYVQSIGLKTIHDWHAMKRGKGDKKKFLPSYIPKAPHIAYQAVGWKGYGDWLGTGYISPQRRKWRSLAGVKKYMKNKGIKSGKEWYIFARGSDTCKGKGKGQNRIPSDIPVGIPNVYKNKGFKGWYSIFGDASIPKSQRKYLSLRAAKKLLQKYKFSTTQYRLWSAGRLKGYPKKPLILPSCPEKVYKDGGWKGMADYLGTN